MAMTQDRGCPEKQNESAFKFKRPSKLLTTYC